jgi:Mlc titration factor MtfA (ptsG expression regulator)
MFKRLRRAWQGHVLFSAKIPYPIWHRVVRAAPVLRALDNREAHRLRKLTSLFLREKTINSVRGFILEEWMRVLIAAQACLLILNIDDGLKYFDGWHEVIVYPDAFKVNRLQRDSSGVVHTKDQRLAGEAWSRGPVVLSWNNIITVSHAHALGSNVVLHEFAHKLDMLNGPADGLPPLHRTMRVADWASAFADAYGHLSEQLARHHRTQVDPYGATNPAEFFAVVSEQFFEAPGSLRDAYPAVYEQLRVYYKQDPGARFGHSELTGAAIKHPIH